MTTPRVRSESAPKSSTVVDDRMRNYYDCRAQEYDDWWIGSGLFASEDRPHWEAEVEILTKTLQGMPITSTLDLACGTGFLSRFLPGLRVALDQSSEMIRIASRRLPGIKAVTGDAVPLPFPDQAFERIFTSHFYGHLLPAERTRFMAEARRVGAELVVVDAAERDDLKPEEWQLRMLSDGSRHRVYKRHFRADALAAELGGETVLHDGAWFVAVKIDLQPL